MRSIWNGAISFGLVSIPIKLVNATESHSISFRQIHVSDGGRVRYRKVCELDGEEVSAAEIGKGYEEADGSLIPITDEDLAQLPIATAKTIEIVSFVPADEIDPLQMDSAYYLAASGATAAKPYTLLREALKRSRKVAIAKYALRGRERLGMLRVIDDVIAMHGLLWPDEIRVPEGVAPEGAVSVREAELDLADALMATLGEVEMASLHDDYREAVEAMVAAKAGGGRPAAAPPVEGGGQVIDLMAALENSVRAAKASRVGSGPSPDAAEEGVAAEVTPIRRKAGRSGAAAAAPKTVGGKKSTASAAAAAAAAAGGGGGGGKKSTAAPAAKKKSAAAAAKKTASGKAATTKSGADGGGGGRGAAAKKAATPRKRTSA
ncbi:Ku protein [Streptomyces sp. ISL-43]|uniref:non-homologous end joining protein Ku n=1 Tax=Streptomyces sp. ISL-43 TaxID=2819183 RepID=UPI001BEC747F|nr:Ku protein [Streptomyces sp. ISL-43]MBT2448229.1 Ku protein [Streptomyces sp. ISL-43]